MNNQPANTLRIDGERLLSNLDELAQIGGQPDGSVHRPALSEADLQARVWLRQKGEAAGFEVIEDGAGNVSVIRRTDNPNAQSMLFGSHLDTVPGGGRYDGALGVVAALEALQTIDEAQLSLPVHLEVVSFTDEEGTWGGLLGSRGFAGKLTPDDLEHPRGGQAALAERMAAAGLTAEGMLNAGRDPATIKAWAEIHIEQGTRLLDTGTDIGVVSGIVGIASYWLTFKGRADHAGTTPMNKRSDAMRGVAEFIKQSRELVTNRFSDGVINCGIVEALPGAFNIVPAEARLAVEFRHGDPRMLEAMREALLSLALHIVEVEGLSLDVEHVGVCEPASMHRDVMTAIEAACQSLGLSHRRLLSYAGHDTQTMAEITRAGMFFVPSVDGASHSAREFTSDSDCINAGNVLMHTVLKLATS